MKNTRRLQSRRLQAYTPVTGLLFGIVLILLIAGAVGLFMFTGPSPEDPEAASPEATLDDIELEYTPNSDGSVTIEVVEMGSVDQIVLRSETGHVVELTETGVAQSVDADYGPVRVIAQIDQTRTFIETYEFPSDF